MLCVSVLCDFGETQQGLKVEDESNDVGDGEGEAIFGTLTERSNK